MRGGGGMRLVLIAGGRTLSTTPLTANEQVVRVSVPVPGYVRAEVRGAQHPAPPGKPLAFEGDKECLTNPVWLVEGATRSRRSTSSHRRGRPARAVGPDPSDFSGGSGSIRRAATLHMGQRSQRPGTPGER